VGGALKPLASTSSSGSGAGKLGLAARPDTSALMAELDAGIDALFDAELSAAFAVPPQPAKAQRSGPVAASGLAPASPRPPVRVASKPQGKPVAQPEVGPGPQADFAGEPTKKVQPILLGAALQASAGERARTRLIERYAPVEEGDYFAVLGVRRDANVGEVRRAHDRIIREIAPDAIEPQLAREMATQIDAIRSVAAEALRVLGDDGLRPRYLSNLPK
jgi:hypothetical protein